MKLIFSYGKKVEPAHDKLNAFTEIAKKYGIETRNVTYNFDDSADKRAALLTSIVRQEAASGEPLILAGTSMGCYGSLLATREQSVAGCFLMSPAIFMDAYEVKDYPLDHAGKVELVVGWNDTVIPVDKVIAFAKERKLLTHMVDDNHAMPDSLPILRHLFDHYLQQLTGKE